MKLNLQIVFALLFVLGTSVDLHAQTTKTQAEVEPEITYDPPLDPDLKLLETFESLEGRDFNAMLAFIDQRMKQKHTNESLSSLTFAYAVCNALNTWRFTSEQTPKARQLGYDYASNLLDSVHPMPPSLSVSFTYCLLNHQIADLRDKRGDDLAQARTQAALRWIDAVRAVESEIDFSFDPDDPKNAGRLNVLPPPGSGVGVFGAGPSAVKDPVLHRQFEAAIEANRVRIQKRTEQSRLRSQQKRANSGALHYLVQAYRKQPQNLEELKTLLALVKDEEFKRKVLAEALKPDPMEELMRQAQQVREGLLDPDAVEAAMITEAAKANTMKKAVPDR